MSNEKEKPWRRPVQEPTFTTEPGGSVVTEHPAFAQISVSRISGGAHLYGSDFLHQGYVKIKVAASKLHRDYSNDRPMAAMGSLIEVNMSEAQWATMVSSLNIGQGVQCTLVSKDGQSIPGLPAPAPRQAQFAGEVRGRMDDAVKALKELEEMVLASGLSKAKQAELLSKARQAHSQITGNIDFVAEQFDEHMENTVQKAGIEINAWAQNVIQRAGLNAIGNGDLAPLRMVSAGNTVDPEESGGNDGQAARPGG